MKKDRIIITISILIDIFNIILLYLFFSKDVAVNIEKLKVLSIFAFLVTISIEIRAFINNKNILDFYKIFIVFYSIYIFGIVFLRYIFNYEVFEITKYLDLLISTNTLYIGILYSLYCLLAINIGYNIFFVNHDIKNIKINDINELKRNEYLKFLGYTLFIISIGFALYELIKTIKLVLILGYRGQIENVSYGINSIGSLIVPFFMISIYCLVISYKDNIIKKNIFFTIGFLYSIILIFLGRRGLPLLHFLGLIIIYYSTIKQINYMTIIKVIGLMCAVTILISIIRENRDKPLNEWNGNIIALISEKIKDNPVNEAIYEMGLGIYPISYSMQLVPSTIPHFKGATYIHSLYNAFLFNFGTSKTNKVSYNVGEIIANYEGYQFGSSFIEEIYCNFNWYGIIFCVLIGYIIALYSNIYTNQTNVLTKILMINMFFEFIWCTKNVLYNLPRLFLFYYISIIILYIIINNGFKLRRTKNEKNIFINI